MPPRSDDFFVGYLATPRGLARFLHIVGLGLIFVTICTAAVIASRQRDPGDGVWESNVNEFAGRLTHRPYPMLQCRDGRTLLLVGIGKVGLEANEGGVRATGTILRRGNLELLEVEGLHAIDTATVPVPAPTAGQRVTLHGEIIDPKCFAGAMKPGTGKTHKACAALCLRGGIPPAVVTDAGEVLVLTSQSRSAISGPDLDRVTAVVGEPITLSGLRTTIGNIHLLEIDPATLPR